MTTKFLLTEAELPDRWYNILADLPEPLGAFLSPQTLQPLAPPDLTPLFPMAIIGQEVSAERWIEIPDRVRDVYKLWRPTPLYRAERLERAQHAGTHLLQVRGRVPRRLAQAQLRRRAGVLQR
jgi:tryptophan synthase beta chain